MDDITYNYPYLHRDRTLRNFRKYVKEYNQYPIQFDNNGNIIDIVIRKTHYEGFCDLIRISDRTIKYHNKKHDINKTDRSLHMSEMLKISTNNKELSERWFCSRSTVWRILERLEKAGLISKIFHGTTANYEIVFEQPEIFEFEDLKSESAKTHNQPQIAAAEDHKIAFCKPYTDNIQGYYNNNNNSGKVSLRDVSNHNIEPHGNIHGDTRQIEQNFENDRQKHHGNTPKANQNLSKSQHTKPLQVENGDSCSNEIPRGNRSGTADHTGNSGISGQKSKKQKISVLQLQYAALVVQMYIDKVLCDTKNTVYPRERAKAIEYVADTYFVDCISEKQIIKRLEKYKWCIEAAGRFKQNHPGYKAPYPRRYFDYDNLNNGFRLTWSWWDKTQNWKKAKQERKNRIKNKKLLNDLAAQFNDSDGNNELWKELNETIHNIDSKLTKKFLLLTQEKFFEGYV